MATLAETFLISLVIALVAWLVAYALRPGTPDTDMSANDVSINYADDGS